ncbi:MAG: hypothetical protein ACP5QT_06955 [Brevinematia bacterium]
MEEEVKIGVDCYMDNKNNIPINIFEVIDAFSRAHLYYKCKAEGLLIESEGYTKEEALNKIKNEIKNKIDHELSKENSLEVSEGIKNNSEEKSQIKSGLKL